MPSFSVSRGAYTYYYQPYINPDKIPRSVFFYSLIVIVLVSVVFTSSQLIPHYIRIRYPVWFIQSGFYWFHDLLILIVHCFGTLFIVLILINCHGPHDIFHKIIQKHSYNVVFCLSAVLTILVILSSITIYFKYKWSNIYLIQSNSILCQYVACDAVDLWDTWIYLIHRAILPFILYVMYLMCCKNAKSIDNYELEMSLIQTDAENMTQAQYVTNVQVTTLYPTISCIIYLSLYSVTIFVLHFQFALRSNLLNNRFELIYIIFNIWHKLLKFISKRTARLCDELRSQQSMNDHYVCLEYLTEWIFGIIYWNFIRYYVVFKATLLSQYLFALTVHFSVEMLQTNIRYTSMFLTLSSYLVKKYYFFEWLLSNNIDAEVWRTRLSMDVMLRFYASLLCTLMIILQFIVYGEDWFEDQFGSNNYYRALIYTLISGITELIHYVLSVVIIQKVNKFNIVRPFLSYLSMMSNKHRMVLLVLYGTIFVMYLVIMSYHV